SSVYVLSERGASSEAARWLAHSENESDRRIGSVNLENKSRMLATVLLDLSQSATIEASTEAANDVLKHLERIGPVHSARVEQAGFMVLKSPDVPSMLVETDFISNPREERKLRNPRYQERIARAVYSGILAYFDQHAPSNTIFAALRREQLARKHVIRPGDTLSGLAQRYKVSMRRLRLANGLTGNELKVGQVLKIPTASGG
ncbi:MAG: N-acetylmuramoyl-L-alanine amidase, partial [Gammaproteobacteria bacterium]|nr:N-acetylmuramoyl-L-alanine amidase [Gammaproteobacteria bacterium]